MSEHAADRPATEPAASAHDHATEEAHRFAYGSADVDVQLRDIGEVPAIELISTVAVHLMSASAVYLGLAEEGEASKDLDEARKTISALAGLLQGSLPYLGDHHARPLRDGLRTLQLAFREASTVPDAIGKGPGEEFTGPVF